MKGLVVLLTLAALWGGCTSVETREGPAEGIEVTTAQTLLRGVADDIGAWDLNGNGILDREELAGLGASIVARLATALTAALSTGGQTQPEP